MGGGIARGGARADGFGFPRGMRARTVPPRGQGGVPSSSDGGKLRPPVGRTARQHARNELRRDELRELATFESILTSRPERHDRNFIVVTIPDRALSDVSSRRRVYSSFGAARDSAMRALLASPCSRVYARRLRVANPSPPPRPRAPFRRRDRVGWFPGYDDATDVDAAVREAFARAASASPTRSRRGRCGTTGGTCWTSGTRTRSSSTGTSPTRRSGRSGACSRRSWCRRGRTRCARCPS